MNIRDLISKLQDIKAEHGGGIQVVVKDADTQWLFKIIDEDLTVESDEKGVRLEIGCDYSSEAL